MVFHAETAWLHGRSAWGILHANAKYSVGSDDLLQHFVEHQRLWSERPVCRRPAAE